MQLTIVRVGNEQRPATRQDVIDVRKSIEYLLNESQNTNTHAVLISHHAIDIIQCYVDQPCLGGMMQQSPPSQSQVVVRGVCDCEDTGPCESEPC